MADYTPYSADLFGNFIQGLKMGQSLKKDKEEKAKAAVTDQYKQMAQEIDLATRTGGQLTSIPAYQDFQTRMQGYLPQQPSMGAAFGQDTSVVTQPNATNVIAPLAQSLQSQMGQSSQQGPEVVPFEPAQLGIQQPTTRNIVNSSIPTTGPTRYGATEQEQQRYMQDQGIADMLGHPSQTLVESRDAFGNVVYTPNVKGMPLPKVTLAPINKTTLNDKSYTKNRDIQKDWRALEKVVTPLRQSSRSAIGVAAINNMRADRMLSVIDQPDLTAQDQFNLVADLQGIFKGGVPDEVALKLGGYVTAKEKIAKIMTAATSMPIAINTPEIHAHLKDVALAIKEVDNKVIKDNFGTAAVAFRELYESDPARFADMFNAVSGTTVSPGEKGYAADIVQPPSKNVPAVGTSTPAISKAGLDTWKKKNKK